MNRSLTVVGRSRIDEQAAAVDAGPLAIRRRKLAAVNVVADDAGQRHVGLEPAEHVGHVGRSAETCLAAFFAQQDDGRFLADPLGVSPGVAVEDQVAQHEHPRPAEFLKQD